MTSAIEEFQKQLRETRPKLPFMVKLLRVLNFILVNPNYVLKVGAFWLPDRQSFVINSKKLAAFLDIHPNSINTNFRQHGFTDPISIHPNQLARLHEGLHEVHFSEAQHWTKRKHGAGTFTSKTTPEEVATLDIESRFAFRANQFQQLQQQRLRWVIGPESAVSAQARTQWEMFFPSALSAPFNEVTAAFLPKHSTDDEAHVDQLRINFAHLWSP
jgi:hypothetical protein